MNERADNKKINERSHMTHRVAGPSDTQSSRFECAGEQRKGQTLVAKAARRADIYTVIYTLTDTQKHTDIYDNDDDLK